MGEWTKQDAFLGQVNTSEVNSLVGRDNIEYDKFLLLTAYVSQLVVALLLLWLM
jgi:hypothetical protein